MWVDLDDGWVGLGGDWIEIVPNGFGGYTAYEWGPFDDLGAGLVLRKKSNRLGELFIFKKASPLPTSPEGKE